MAKPCCACSRSSSDEIFQLREDNAALQYENMCLRVELQRLRQQLWTLTNPVCDLDQGITSIPTAETSQPSSSQNTRRSKPRRGRRPSTITIEEIASGPFYHTCIESKETAAERFISEALALSDEYDVDRAVLLHTTFPDKIHQLMLRAHLAKKFFPPGMTQLEYDGKLRHTKVDLRNAAARICDPVDVNDVLSVFINAFHKRSPKCLAKEATRLQWVKRQSTCCVAGRYTQTERPSYTSSLPNLILW